MAQRLQPHRPHSARLRAGVAAVPQPKLPGTSAALIRDQLARHVGRTLGNEGLLILDDTGFPGQAGDAFRSACNANTPGHPGQGRQLPDRRDAPVRHRKRAVVWACPDAALYLPEDSWGNNPERLTAAGVPEGIGYRPRWQIGLGVAGAGSGQRFGRSRPGRLCLRRCHRVPAGPRRGGLPLVCRCREDLEGDRGRCRPGRGAAVHGRGGRRRDRRK